MQVSGWPRGVPEPGLVCAVGTMPTRHLVALTGDVDRLVKMQAPAMSARGRILWLADETLDGTCSTMRRATRLPSRARTTMG